MCVCLPQRESLRADLDSKFSVIFHSYGQELLNIQETYQRLRENPPRARNLPPVYGAIAWARHLLNRIQEPMRHFQENKKVWLAGRRMGAKMGGCVSVWEEDWERGSIGLIPESQNWWRIWFMFCDSCWRLETAARW